MLTDNQKKRYSRQIALAEIGQPGQSALLESSVLVVGAGGLGCPVLQLLATAGVGRIGVVDHDRIELSNLHRQFLYHESDVGRAKAQVAAVKLKQLNSDVEIAPYIEKLTQENVASLIADYDIIVDGCDDFQTRFILNDACVNASKTLVSGAVSEWHGQVAVFEGYKRAEPCYQCFCPSEPPVSGRVDCSMAGVTGVLTSLIGSKVAMEVVRYITQAGDASVSRLMRYDGIKNRFSSSLIHKDPKCSVCA